MGSVERALRAGLPEILVCHRGFNVYHASDFRNPPLWEIPLEFKRRFPDIPMVCDHSHICCSRTRIAEIAQKALDFGYEGLMIEVHPTPDHAWSDAQQQLTPLAFAELYKQLVFKKANSQDELYQLQLSSLRELIDEADTQLMSILSARLQAAQKIGDLKKANGVAFFQHDRWSEVLGRAQAQAQKYHIQEAFAEQLFNLIHLASLDIQGE